METTHRLFIFLVLRSAVVVPRYNVDDAIPPNHAFIYPRHPSYIERSTPASQAFTALTLPKRETAHALKEMLNRYVAPLSIVL